MIHQSLLTNAHLRPFKTPQPPCETSLITIEKTLAAKGYRTIRDYAADISRIAESAMRECAYTQPMYFKGILLRQVLDSWLIATLDFENDYPFDCDMHDSPSRHFSRRAMRAVYSRLMQLPEAALFKDVPKSDDFETMVLRDIDFSRLLSILNTAVISSKEQFLRNALTVCANALVVHKPHSKMSKVCDSYEFVGA
jgi:hypothetical protein